MLCAGHQIPDGCEPSWLQFPFVMQLQEGREPWVTLQAEPLIFLSGAKPARPPVAYFGKHASISYNRAGTMASQTTILYTILLQ